MTAATSALSQARAELAGLSRRVAGGSGGDRMGVLADGRQATPPAQLTTFLRRQAVGTMNYAETLLL
jgi:hypothetical protein